MAIYAGFHGAGGLKGGKAGAFPVETLDMAERFLGETFDWDAPKEEWRRAVVADMLKHFEKPTNIGTTSVYGRAIRRLNGGRGMRSNGISYVWLPPLKPRA